MRRVYLLIYTGGLAIRIKIKLWADNSPLVKTWRTDLPNTYYLVSESTAAELAADIERSIRKMGRYLILEASDNRQGRLPTESWYLMRHKRKKPS